MNKYCALFLTLLVCSGCGMISKQYYYVPSVAHQTFKGRFGRTDFKMIYSRFKVSGSGGDSVGSIVTSNGTGHRLLMGPLLPVIPVGGFFQKSDNQFVMEMAVNCSADYLIPPATGRSGYKGTKDSLSILKVSAERPLQNSQCYMIVNDTLKVPLRAGEPFVNDTHSHNYWMTAAIPFRKVRSLKLITGNPVLDSTLRNVTFKRKSRLKFDLIGPGY